MEQYIVSLAKRAKQENEILDALLDNEFPATQQTRNFSHQLYLKYAPQSAPEVN